ncbi:hypothetical protein MRX96_032429 [Rhipicephalus microplus]
MMETRPFSFSSSSKDKVLFFSSPPLFLLFLYATGRPSGPLRRLLAFLKTRPNVAACERAFSLPEWPAAWRDEPRNKKKRFAREDRLLIEVRVVGAAFYDTPPLELNDGEDIVVNATYIFFLSPSA